MSPKVGTGLWETCAEKLFCSDLGCRCGILHIVIDVAFEFLEIVHEHIDKLLACAS